jgi:hypothetical protein
MNCTVKPDIKDTTYPHLRFVMDNNLISSFFLLLQQGVRVKAGVGCSVRMFLEKEFGVTPDILERIQSIFLNGRPVDDIDSAVVRDGSILAVSAAMPGLVGATLRRGGAYSSFRNTITYRETEGQYVPGEGFVHVKIFNLLMDTLGPGLLRKGIFEKSSKLIIFLKGQSGDFWQGCRQVLLNGKPLNRPASEYGDLLSQHDWIFLSVTVQEGDA